MKLDESKEKNELKKVVSKKEKKLNKLIEKLEQLKIDLTTIKQEYEIKVGRLYLRLDEIELEILKYKRIEDLMNKGFSFEEAQKTVEENLKEKQEQIQKEYQKIDDEGKEFASRSNISKEKEDELKQIWRKLAMKYHPDKANGNEELMKKINKAYTEGDLETLKAIDKSEYPEAISEELTIEQLRKRLIIVEQSIKKVSQEIEQLQKSEWFILKENIEKAKKQNRDLLSELAEKILTDIAKKENRLKELKEKYGQI
jgi:uncharacterized protein YoaH (UPF0181 family)